MMHPRTHDPTAHLLLSRKLRLFRRNLEHRIRNGLLKLFQTVRMKDRIQGRKIDLSKLSEQRLLIKKILMIRTGKALGDAIMSLVLVPECRRLFPGAHLDLLLRDHLSSLFKEGAGFDGVLELHPRFLKWPLATWNLLWELRRNQYDLVIACDNPRKSSFTTLCLSLYTKAPLRVGFATEESRGAPRAGARGTFGSRLAEASGVARVGDTTPKLLRRGEGPHSPTGGSPWPPAEAGGFFNVMVSSRPEKPMVANLLGLVEPFGSVSHKVIPQLIPSDRCLLEANPLLKTNANPIVIFVPNHWRKSWPLESFLKIADALIRQGYFVTLAFGPGDDRIQSRDVQDWVLKSEGHADLLFPQRLPVFAAFLSRCQLFISNDCGPYHLAVAVGTPCISIFLTPETRDEFGYQFSGRFLTIYQPIRENAERLALEAAQELLKK